MITRLVKMTFRHNSIPEFLELFEQVKERILDSPGCMRLDLMQDKNQPKVIFTYSIWNREQDLEAYRSSTLFKKTWSKTKLLFDEKPEAWSTRILSSGVSNQ